MNKNNIPKYNDVVKETIIQGEIKKDDRIIVDEETINSYKDKIKAYKFKIKINNDRILSSKILSLGLSLVVIIELLVIINGVFNTKTIGPVLIIIYLFMAVLFPTLVIGMNLNTIQQLNSDNRYYYMVIGFYKNILGKLKNE